jgi:hypothetical protein
VADLLVVVGAVVVVVAAVPVVAELAVVPEPAVLMDEPLPDFVVVLATMAVVVPGISAATAVPIPAVPRTATSTMAAVVRRIRRVRDRRLIVFAPFSPLCLCIASSFPSLLSMSAFDAFNVRGLSAPCVCAVPLL